MQHELCPARGTEIITNLKPQIELALSPLPLPPMKESVGDVSMTQKSINCLNLNGHSKTKIFLHNTHEMKLSLTFFFFLSNKTKISIKRNVSNKK